MNKVNNTVYAGWAKEILKTIFVPGSTAEYIYEPPRNPFRLFLRGVQSGPIEVSRVVLYFEIGKTIYNSIF